MKLLISLISIGYCYNLFAINIKIATLVPKGTNWAKTIQAMADEVELVTQNRVKFRIYYGGIQGDEPVVLQKTRIAQIHGGVFTGKTLGDIFSDVRAIEVPFNFYHDDKKAMDAVSSNSSYFNNRILEEGFVNLGFYGIGKVYVVSTKKVKSLDELKGIKMWAWEGDQIIRAMMDSLGLVSVPLALPDVMSSLSTGIIEAAYAPPLGILALQWQNKIKYLIDFPTAYTIGALLIANKQWEKVGASDQKAVRDLATKYIDQANSLANEDNQKALDTLKKLGVEFVQFSDSDLKQAEKIRLNVVEKLKGVVLSETILNKIESQR